MDRNIQSIQVCGTALEVLTIDAPVDASVRAPIVFLHEGLGSVSHWQQKEGYWPKIVCERSARAGLVYSRRGYGQSETIANYRDTGRLPADYLQREALEVLPALLKTMGIQRPVLLGHSDGASIALIYASRFVSEACIAIAPHLFVEQVSLDAIAQARSRYQATQQDPSGLRARLSKHHRDIDCAFWQWNDVWLSDAFRGFDIQQECTTIQCPVLALQGLNDPYGTMAQMRALQTAMAHNGQSLQVESFADCGHSPQRECFAMTTSIVASFLA